jgi:serine/threonine protein kinase
MAYPVWNKHAKWVAKNELESYLMIDRLRPVLGNDIAPKIIKIVLDPDRKDDCPYVLITERYTTTLKNLMEIDYEKSIMVMKRAKKLVKKLHSLKILHTDLYEGNIVYDEPTNRVSLIDFDQTADLTEFLKKVTPDLNMDSPLTKEDQKYVGYAELYEENDVEFINKDTYLFELELKFFERLLRRIEYLK